MQTSNSNHVVNGISHQPASCSVGLRLRRRTEAWRQNGSTITLQLSIYYSTTLHCTCKIPHYTTTLNLSILQDHITLQLPIILYNITLQLYNTILQQYHITLQLLTLDYITQQL